MARVAFLRGVNVGGHRTFRPSVLARELNHLEVVNIGAAGTFVVWKPVTRAELHAELKRRLPFATEIISVRGREVLGLVSKDFFSRHPSAPDIVRFVSVLSGRPRLAPQLPVSFPSDGKWLLRVLARDGRFVIGQYRRHMKVIGHLGALDRLFGVRVTTRNWNTLNTIAQVLAAGVIS